MRASSLDRALTCPQSVQRSDGELRIGSDESPARRGSAFHRAIQDYIELGRTDPAEKYADAFHADPAELGELIRKGRYCWDQLSEHFPAPMLELDLSEAGPLQLTGHPDVLSVPAEVRIVDWKTGREESEHSEQLRGYGYLALDAFPGADKAWCVVVDVRHEEIREPVTFTRDELGDWYRWATERMQADANLYVPGAACRFCPRSATCPGKTALLHQAKTALLEVDAGEPMADLTDDQLVKLHAMLGLMRHAIDKTGILLKGEVSRRGGKVVGDQIGDGLELVTQTRRRLDARKALPLLSALLPFGDVADCSTIGVTKVMAALKANGVSIQQVLVELEEAGAMLRDEVELLRPRRGLKPLSGAVDVQEGESLADTVRRLEAEVQVSMEALA